MDKQKNKKDLERIKKLLREKGKKIPSISFIWTDSDYPMIMSKNMDITHVYIALEILTEYFATTSPETKEILYKQIDNIYKNMYNNTGSIN